MWDLKNIIFFRVDGVYELPKIYRFIGLVTQTGQPGKDADIPNSLFPLRKELSLIFMSLDLCKGICSIYQVYTIK